MRTIVIACCLWSFLLRAGPLAAEEAALPKLAAAKPDVERLGEEFKDERIRFRAPKDLQRAKMELKPEVVQAGFYSYAWTPGGTIPSLEVINLTCGPPPQPGRDTLDDGVAGMQSSIRKAFEDVKFGEVKKGTLNGIEVRAGEYRGTLADQKIFAVYLMGVDAKGTFGLSAMMPEEKATEERVRLVQAALLTFQRAE